jgi:hypothetical protein
MPAQVIERFRVRCASMSLFARKVSGRTDESKPGAGC